MSREQLLQAHPNIHAYTLTWNIPDGAPGTVEQERFAANCMTGAARVRAKKLLKKLMIEAPKDHVSAVTLRDDTLLLALGSLSAVNGKIVRDWED